MGRQGSVRASAGITPAFDDSKQPGAETHQNLRRTELAMRAVTTVRGRATAVAANRSWSPPAPGSWRQTGSPAGSDPDSAAATNRVAGPMSDIVELGEV